MLKAVVGILGVLIILGTAAVIGTVIHRLYARNPVASMPVAAQTEAAAGLAPGERVAGIASAGGDLAVWVTGPKGDRVVLFDPASGRETILLEGGK